MEIGNWKLESGKWKVESGMAPIGHRRDFFKSVAQSSIVKSYFLNTQSFN